MEISVHFKKKPWVRMVHPDKASGRFISNYKPLPGSSLDVAYVQLTAQDFLKELNPAAHPINSRYMSTRPIYKPSGKKDENGHEELVLDGYDELESVALGWQKFIVSNKVAHLTGDGVFDTANETLDDARYANLLSLLDYAGARDAVTEALYYCEHSCDSGILLYQTADGELDWEVYATEKGHTIYPQKDEDGNPIYYIQYQKDGEEMCDIISNRFRETWIHAKERPESEIPLLEKIWRVIGVSAGERSEDGWTLVKRDLAQAGSDLNQFIYFWVPDIASGPAELTIEAAENAASYVANEVKSTAFPLLVVKSEKMSVLPPSEINGKILGIKGSADTLAHADAKYETPGDASNIATLHFKELNDDIIRTTQSAIITPDIMKQGADSSTAIKILFRPEIEWAKQRWIFYYKPIRQFLKVFKRLVGKIEGDLDGYEKLRISVWQKVWIPQNEKEQTEIVTQKVYARVLSRKAALNELGSQYKGDYAQIDKEWREELQMKAEIPAKVNAEYGSSNSSSTGGEDTNPYAPKINNQDPGKTIAEN